MSNIVLQMATAAFIIALIVVVSGCNSASKSLETGRDCQVMCEGCEKLILDCGATSDTSNRETKVPQ